MQQHQPKIDRMDALYEMNDAPNSQRPKKTTKPVMNRPKCEQCLITECRTCKLEKKMNVMADEICFLKNMVHMLCLKDLRNQSCQDSENLKCLEEAADNIKWLKIIVDALSSQLVTWKKTHEKHIENFEELSFKVDGLMSVSEQVQKVIEELNRLKSVVENPRSISVTEIEKSVASVQLNDTDRPQVGNEDGDAACGGSDSNIRDIDTVE